MIIYTYSCDACGVDTDAQRAVEERHDAPPCKVCHGVTHLAIQPVSGAVKNPAVPRKNFR